MINHEHIESTIIAYLEDALSPPEKQAIEAWIKQSDENQLLFNQTKKIWEAFSPDHNFEVDENIAWQKVKNKIENQEAKVIQIDRKKSNYQFLWKAAAIFIGFVVLVTALNNWYSGTIDNQLTITVVAQNDHEMVTLPDGSEITLRKNAELQYPEKFGKQKRTVKFKGEGYFAIAKNANAPFTIDLPNSKIEVLGTEFLIKTNDKEKKESVVVSSGKVKFSSKSNKANSVELIMNQEAELSVDSDVILKQESKDPNILAWKTKILEFDKTNLKEVIAAIENLYQIKINLKDPEMQNCRLSARFDNQQIDDVLQTLAATFEIEITKDGTSYTLSGQGC